MHNTMHNYIAGFISMIMTCIGFCQHKTPPPQQQPQIQVVMANAVTTLVSVLFYYLQSFSSSLSILVIV